jgi:hypothetical protein
MNFDPIIEILDSSGEVESEKSLFINFVPGGLEGILLRDYFGGTPVDHELPGFIRGSFMLIARGVDYVATKERLEKCIEALKAAGDAQETWGGVRLNYLRPRTLPFSYAPSAGEFHEITVTMDACYVDLP